MKTSYFGKVKENFPNAVAICRYSPDWWSGFEYKALAPSAKLLSDYRGKGISDAEYGARYQREVLDLLDPRVTYETICKMADPDAILVCWEGPTKFCHRQLVAQWFEDEIGCKIPELV